MKNINNKFSNERYTRRLVKEKRTNASFRQTSLNVSSEYPVIQPLRPQGNLTYLEVEPWTTWSYVSTFVDRRGWWRSRSEVLEAKAGDLHGLYQFICKCESSRGLPALFAQRSSSVPGLDLLREFPQNSNGRYPCNWYSPSRRRSAGSYCICPLLRRRIGRFRKKEIKEKQERNRKRV